MSRWSATIKDVPPPRFTLRRLLLLVTVCAVLCLVPTIATQGFIWALGLAMAGIAGVLLIVSGALLYACTLLIGGLLSRARRR